MGLCLGLSHKYLNEEGNKDSSVGDSDLIVATVSLEFKVVLIQFCFDTIFDNSL